MQTPRPLLLAALHLTPISMGNIIVAQPNESAIISGCRGTRILVGACGFQLWCLERVDRISLEIITDTVLSEQAETAKGVRINLRSATQIKIKANTTDMSIDMASIRLAAQHFLSKDGTEILAAVHKTMEGHQRMIIGTLTVEELYQDRAAFASRVRELVHDDLEHMGFELVSYTVVAIDDALGYIKALGETQTAVVKREAQEGKARNEAEARKNVAQAKATADIAAAEAERSAHIRINEMKQGEALADRDLELKRAEYLREVNEATAIADAAKNIATAQQHQTVVRETTQQKVEEAAVMVEVMERRMDQEKREREGRSQAALMEERNVAEAVRVNAEAEAERIRRTGEANADAVAKKGQAEAAVLREKALAYKEYGEAALAQIVVQEMPQIAAEIAAPLAKTEKMVFVSGDGSSGSRLTGDVARIMSEIPDTVNALTGVDLKKIMKRAEGGAAAPQNAV